MEHLKFLGFVYLLAGMTASLLFLRICYGKWDDIPDSLGWVIGTNSLTVFMAFISLWKRPIEEYININSVLVVACYVVGIVGGVCYFFT